MLTLLSEVKFLTTRDDISIKDTDLGAFKYKERKSLSKANQPLVDGKQEYAFYRDQQYILHGRKSKHVINSVKKLEEMMKHNRVVYCAWSDNVVMQMLLSNGLLVHICIDIYTGDINRISFDRFLIGKLISEAVTDVIMSRMHILISYDMNQMTFVYLQKPNLKKNIPKKIRRLDPKIFNIIISGSHTRKISRHLTCNNSYDLLAVWTKSSQNEVYPWRPTVRDQDRANIHIYRLHRNKLDLICYYWTENDPINVEFSKMNQNQLRSIEQKISRKGEVTIEICVYEVNKSKIQRTSVTSIPLQSQVCCHSFSPDNEKLMLGCIDGSVIFFDEGRGITHLIKAAFIPTLVSWHADSAIVMIANEKCQIQCFDISLSGIRYQMFNEEMTSDSVLELTNYFTSQPSLSQMCCSRKPDLTQYNEKYIQCDSFVLLLFENGPITILRLYGGNGHKGDVHTSGFTADVLIQQYLKMNNVEKAINILLCLNWDVYGAMLMISLHKIASYIFKQPFQPEREAQLQKALGSFLVPVKPLCVETRTEFGDQVKDITRKFFQYLLKYKSYEKAFILAIDIDDEDLFMDLTNCAKEDGFLELAHHAYQKAEDILARSDSIKSSHSICSHESCSECVTNSSAEDSGTDRSWEEISLKNKSSIVSKAEVSQYTSQKPQNVNNCRNLKHPAPTMISSASQNIRANMPRTELKVSHYSKNTTEFRNQLKPIEMIKIAENMDYSATRSIYTQNMNEDKFTGVFSENKIKFVNHKNSGNSDPLKYQQSGKIQNSLPRLPLSVSQIVQPILQHHVIDVVPKPNSKQFSFNNMPDQTIGIPIHIQDNKLKSIHNISENTAPIIHHPLVSGNIPPKPISRSGLILSSSILTATIQQTPHQKKDNNERNKVKFSNTVTVAVVPVSSSFST